MPWRDLKIVRLNQEIKLVKAMRCSFKQVGFGHPRPTTIIDLSRENLSPRCYLGPGITESSRGQFVADRDDGPFPRTNPSLSSLT